jgi:hypothetical protein
MKTTHPIPTHNRSPKSRAFHAPRFALLLRAQWAEQHRSWAAFLLVFASIYALCLLLALSTSGYAMLTTDGQAAFYTAGLLVSGYLFAGRYFAGIDKREGSLLLLMQPASANEKILVAALVILLLYPLAYTAMFELLTWPARKLAYALAQENFQRWTSPGMKIDRSAPKVEEFAAFWPFMQDARNHAMIALMYWGLTAYSLACSLYFRSAALLKSWALAAALFLLTSMWAIFTRPDGDMLAVWWQRGIASPSWSAHLLTAALWLGIPLLLWLSAYWNLRERQLS